jgi:hypothetical protein
MVVLILQQNIQHFLNVHKHVENWYEYDQHSNQVDHFFVLNHHVENNQVDNQLNDIDPKVNDENELVLELFEHESVKLNHFVELNFPNPKNEKKKDFRKIQKLRSWSFIL